MIGLNKALSNRKPANLGGKEIKLSNMKMVKVTNFKEVANQAEPHNQISLRFLSPTSFRSRGEQKVFPEPESVFSSLLRKWNAFSNIKFPKELEEEFSKIRVTRYSTRTELVEFSNYKIIGFKGTCSYELPKGISDESKRQINTLADFAFYAGVGYKTTMGMGQTVRIDSNGRR
jgi:CRISPR-associated endoribonuclease Cas6